jgi:hypothetical protein
MVDVLVLMLVDNTSVSGVQAYGKDFTMTRLPARTAGVPMVIPQAATTGRELMVIPGSLVQQVVVY